MPYAVLEPSGCGVHKNRVKLRIDLFMNPDDPHYDKHHVYMPVFPEKGYSGKVNKLGDPIKQADFDAWETSLPHIWQNNPFHSHFIHPELEASDSDVKREIERCLDYFYSFHQYAWDNDKQFIDEWKKAPKKTGDVRCPFVKGDPKDLRANEQKVADVLTRLPEFVIGKKIVPKTDLNIGDKGTIDVGSTAEDRAGRHAVYWDVYYYTIIDYNNAANADGSLDTVKAWFNQADANNSVKIGTFADGGSGVFTCNDAEVIGEVTAGSEQTYTGLSIDILTGEFIGADSRAAVEAYIERDYSGGSGLYWAGGQLCDPTDSDTFSLLAGDILSLNATGEEGNGVIEQSVGGGAITPTGALGIKVFKGIGDGAVTPSGTLGLLVKMGIGAGSITPTGALSTIKRFFVSVGGGAITPAGALGTVLKFLESVGQGAITPVGVLGLKIKLAVGSGSITPSGVLGLLIKIAIGAGAITPSGALGLLVKLAVGSGAITPSGALGAVKKILKNVGQGAITPTGALGRKIAVSVGSGSITAIGELGRKIKIAVGGGSLTPVGSLITTLVRWITVLLSLRQNLNVKLEAKQNLLVGLLDMGNLGVVLEAKPQLRTELLAKSNLNVKMEGR